MDDQNKAPQSNHQQPGQPPVDGLAESYQPLQTISSPVAPDPITGKVDPVISNQPVLGIFSANSSSMNTKTSNKKLIWVIASIVMVLILVGGVYFLLSAIKSNKSTSSTVSNTSTKSNTNKAPTTTGISSNSAAVTPPSTPSPCGANTNPNLVCYSVASEGTNPGYSILFYPNSTISSAYGPVMSLAAKGGSGAVMQVFTAGSDCTGATSTFTYNYQGSSIEGCYYARYNQYGSAFTVAGTTYSTNLNANNALDLPTVETIMSSIKIK
jgi:hypothetical protein